ncbi:MAG: leucine-rich repeat domain-containing protein, partial [Bacillota bacterium]|nr:leucine-rich repeat domain-containing protein [Bacillota bacterium]
MFKKLTVILLTLSMILVMFPVSAFADKQLGDFTYTEADGKITITGYTGAGGDVTIPNTIDGKPVTSIGDYAFAFCSSLTSITIPGSVTNIGGGAFAWCNSLTAINVDPSNTAYSSADGVLFNIDKTTLIQYPGGKTGTEYTIPESVTSIGEGAFAGCNSLTAINVDPSNTAYSSADGVLFNIDKTTLIQYPGGKTGTEYTIPESVTSIGE